MSTTPLIHRRALPLAGIVMLLGVVTGCGGPSLTCANIANADVCDRVMQSALAHLPSGATSITAGWADGVAIPPYAVVACYPDGRSIAVEVTLQDDHADVRPWSGGPLLNACDQ